MQPSVSLPRRRMCDMSSLGFTPMEFGEPGTCTTAIVTRGSLRYPIKVPKEAKLRPEVDHCEALQVEVQKNGCGKQLMTKDGKDLVSIARSYREHPFHVAIGKPLNDGELLALVLYTGCDCTYDLTACLLSEDYETWSVFDFTLCMAIGILSWHFRSSEVPLYTGLANVYLDSDRMLSGNESGFLRCHTSTSPMKEVAEKHRGVQGVLITIPPQTPSEYFPGSGFGGMAPVHWISKFRENEAEILFSRFSWYSWDFKQVSCTSGRQEVSTHYIVGPKLCGSIVQ